MQFPVPCDDDAEKLIICLRRSGRRSDQEKTRNGFYNQSIVSYKISASRLQLLLFNCDYFDLLHLSPITSINFDCLSYLKRTKRSTNAPSEYFMEFWLFDSKYFESTLFIDSYWLSN